jgi:hypothetical protein
VALAALALPAVPANAAPDGLRTTEVSFVGNGGVVLHGTVLAPAATQRRPGLVMVQAPAIAAGRSCVPRPRPSRGTAS